MNRIEPYLGIAIGIGCIILGNLFEGGSVLSLIQVTAAMIVLGGTLGATILSSRVADLRLALSLAKQVFSGDEDLEREKIANEIIATGQMARKDSVLALESQIARFSDPFMRTVYRFAVDGVEENVLRRIFTEEIKLNERRKNAAAKVWADAGGFAPTMGIIGAVLGLIQVMANITDTSALGHGIAVAFVATVYGVGSANLLFIPISNKMRAMIRHRSETELMILEGAIAVHGGSSPFIIEQRLRSFATNPRVEQTL